jgi:hypothetical protein
MASSPEEVKERMQLQEEEFRAYRLNIFNAATQRFLPGVWDHLYDKEGLQEMRAELYPLFPEFRADADYLKVHRQVAGIRNRFYKNQFLIELFLYRLESNVDFWWNLSATDSSATLRDQTLTLLQRYYSGEKPDVDAMLRVAELMFFNPMGQPRLKDRVSTICFRSISFRRDPEKLRAYEEGVGALLDRLEQEPRAEKLVMEAYRKKLTRYSREKEE